MNPAGQNYLTAFQAAKEHRSLAAEVSRVGSGPLLGHGIRAAFTLIELMMVIALIGILSAMIVPEMRGTFEEALLRSTSRQLVNLCSLASSRAISVQEVHRVRLDPRSGRYVIEKPAPRARTGNEFVPDRDVAESEGQLDNRISIRFRRPAMSAEEKEGVAERTAEEPAVDAFPGQVLVSFYPDGTADAGEIQLRDRQGFGLLLRISPVSARVRVVELARE